MCRFSAQYWIITTPREASGPASGGSMKIFAGGCSLVSGITGAAPQVCVALCATAVMAHNTMAVIDSRDAPFFRVAMFFLLNICADSKQESRYRLSCSFANS